MQKHNIDSLSTFLNEWQSNEEYFKMLQLMSQLSKLFSDSEIPYLDYRLAENIFCKYFNAMNDARSCTAYDARIGKVGIGIKTFTLPKDKSVEKIAEFNKLQKELKNLKGVALARQLGVFRNERMDFANIQYDVTESQYHIVGRKEGLLRVFNTAYDKIDLEHIHVNKDDDTSCSFHDEKHEFIFNKSKSVLQQRFIVPKVYKDIEVNILEEPFDLLEKFFSKQIKTVKGKEKKVKGKTYIILPLYSTKKGIKYVPEKSGLNQFNAGGRKRNALEVYIPVPSSIHKNFPNFFPDRDTPFALILPDGNVLSAKICQQGGKALMSNPNSALGEWILRKILKKKEGELVTIDELNRYGFDSICVEKLNQIDSEGRQVYRLAFSDTAENFDSFIEED